jgi:prepilin-type processing-associated H-X9-DG protein
MLVLLMLGTGGGLVVVGVVKVRAAAARMSCRNNMRQLGLAVHNYETTYNCLPAAAIPNPDLEPERRLSWLVGLSPFIEASDLYAKMDKNKDWEAEENRFAGLWPFKTFACPAYADPAPVNTLAGTNYVGCAGVGVDAITLPLEDPRAGCFGYERKVSAKELKGRTSTLLMVLETGRVQGAWTAAGAATVRGLNPEQPPYLGVGAQFGGLHPGSTNLLFADGAAHWASDRMRPDLLEAMAVALGGEDLTPLPDD